MSPTLNRYSEFGGRFPRVSGDEPNISGAGRIMAEFSPRERG